MELNNYLPAIISLKKRCFAGSKLHHVYTIEFDCREQNLGTEFLVIPEVLAYHYAIKFNLKINDETT
jgi:hypothetical protein